MIEQRVENNSLKGWRGPALILAIALAVLIGSGVFDWLGRYIGRSASLLFIVYGCAIAWFLLNRYVLGFIYTCGGGCLRISRVYGKRERFMMDVWLSNAKACGSPEDMKKRFPDARVRRAVKRGCPIEALALAYDNDGRVDILLLQPNDRLRSVLIQAVKK